MSKTEKLKEIRDEVWNSKKLPLYKERMKEKNFAVLGEGSHDANIMFVGEAPGRTEAKTGKPFCGAAGKVLDQILESLKIQRSDVYVTNLIKDRPPHNRDPLPEEIEAYAPYLFRQIEAIQPKIIATLGRFSMAYIMNTFGLGSELLPISKIHGKSFKADTSYGEIIILPLYHPAVAVYNRNMIDVLKKDAKVLSEI
jgi:uracil-DNA glycosylase family 4